MGQGLGSILSTDFSKGLGFLKGAIGWGNTGGYGSNSGNGGSNNSNGSSGGSGG